MRYTTWIVAILLAIFVVLISLHVVYRIGAFYEDPQIASVFVAYLDGRADLPQDVVSEMSNRELVHMEDVRTLFLWSQIVLICLGGLLTYLIVRSRSLHVLRAASVRAASLLIVFAGVSLVVFNSFFTLAHHVLFRNDYWLLPPDSYLIQAFPQATFFWIFAVTLLSAIGFLLLLYVLLRYYAAGQEQREGTS